MKTCDIAVVGAGPAGMMAAIRAAELNKKVTLAERNDSIGKKMLLTGKGRCNITNSAPIDIFIKKFGRGGEFFRTAFTAFSNNDLIDFFKSKGLEMKFERQGRIFPATDKAASILKALSEYLSDNKIETIYGKRLKRISKKKKAFELGFEDGSSLVSDKVILAMGGASYKATGSTGDGFRIAEELGHTIIPLKAWLVPLKAKEPWVKDLQGLSLENIRLVFEYGNKKIVSDIGELIFTHFGVSGPLVLDLSGNIVSILEKHKEIRLLIDLKPGLNIGQLENRLLKEFKAKGNTALSNVMKALLPNRLIEIFVHLLKLNPSIKASQITKNERRSMITLFKALPLTITGSLPIEEAMVTGGGVSTKDINPRTMESRIVPGLYFAGEIIEGAAPSGGYNLQQAFSTGYLAGEKAAYA